MILKKQKKNDESREAFEKALKLSPENVVAIDQLADLDLEAGAFSAVHQRADALLQKEPKSAPAYFIHGRSYVMEKNFPNFSYSDASSYIEVPSLHFSLAEMIRRE